jgi:hypothetical protein
MPVVEPVKPFAPRRGSPVPVGAGWLVSIDPGRHTGWALWTCENVVLRACGVGWPPYEDASKVAIELPQAYPNSPVPYNDLIKLAFLAGRYVGDFGGSAEFVLPHAWKGNLPKSVCEARARMKLTPFELAITAIAEGVVPKGQHGDMWDSIAIGLFVFKGVKL